jgi:hypothetical protein
MTRARRRIAGDDNVPRKGNWYLLTGLVIGILFGLIISWVVAPVKYIDTVPSSLRSDFKDEFRSQIASAFYATNNLPRALARLDLLGDIDVIQALTRQAQNLLDNGDPTNKAYQLALLTSALKQNSGESLDITSSTVLPENTSTIRPTGTTLTSTVGTPSNQPTLINTPTLRPSSTPSPTQGAPFVLKSNQVICDLPQKSLLLQVEVTNSAGQPIPSTEIIITWSSGEEHFFTGLKPEIGDGYADYLMTPDVAYSIQFAKGGPAVSNLSAPFCSSEAGTTIWGSIKLVFQQP